MTGAALRPFQTAVCSFNFCNLFIAFRSFSEPIERSFNTRPNSESINPYFQDTPRAYGMHCEATVRIRGCASARNCDLEAWLSPLSCGQAVVGSGAFAACLLPLSVLFQLSGESMLVGHQLFGVLIGSFYVG